MGGVKLERAQLGNSRDCWAPGHGTCGSDRSARLGKSGSPAKEGPTGPQEGLSARNELYVAGL